MVNIQIPTIIPNQTAEFRKTYYCIKIQAIDSSIGSTSAWYHGGRGFPARDDFSKNKYEKC